MKLHVHHDNGEITSHDINKESFYNKEFEDKISFINSSKKEDNALNIYKSYFSNAKSILFDNTNKGIVRKLDELNIKEFNDQTNNNNIFEKQDFSFVYFTSGTTGSPVGALKTKENIENEIKVLTSLFAKYNLKRVIVTVPFIHFYGSLMGLIFPYLNNVDIILKEHFLPNDLIDLIDDNSLIVTTPLYIKSLNRITQTKDLSSSVFLSSTAPLFKDTAIEFNKKFNCDIVQLFGSTETGGIAYKNNDDELWTSLDSVQTSTNKDNELIIQSPFVSSVLYENEFKYTHNKIQTFDYVELNNNNKFKLIGRSSQILKVAGKRYSTIQIENILENTQGITKALVTIKTKKEELRGESLLITIQSNEVFLVKDIKKIIQNELSNIKFSIKLNIVEEIKTTAIGKKIKID